MVTVIELTPLPWEVPSTVQLLKVYPVTDWAVKITLADASYHQPFVGPASPVGFLVGWGLSPAGSVRAVKRYWVFQFHVMLEAWVMVKLVVVDDPEAGTLPVPVQPVQT
jgi:hypothetical protein